MTELSSEQFREHLDRFHSQLGVDFGPGHVAVGGARIPTSRQTISLQGTPEGTAAYLYAGVPAESGRVHSMSARVFPEGSRSADMSAIDMNVGRHNQEGSAWLQPGHGAPEMADPAKFVRDVGSILSRSETPSPEERTENAAHLKASAGERHGINVEHAPDRNAATRRYHFDHGTGKLTPDAYTERLLGQ